MRIKFSTFQYLILVKSIRFFSKTELTVKKSFSLVKALFSFRYNITQHHSTDSFNK